MRRLYRYLMSKIQIFCGSCCGKRKKRKKKDSFLLRFKTGPQSYIQGSDLMARMTFEEQVEVSVAPVTAKGNPAKIDGDVVWTSSDDLVFTVASTGPTAGLVVAVAPGVAQLLAEFDADLDVGEFRTMTASAAVEVVEAEAQSVEITFGTPVLKP